MIRQLLESSLVEDSLADNGWAAAVVVAGKTFTGDTHADCWYEYAAELGVEEDDFYGWWDQRHETCPDNQEGFVGPDSQFYTRDGALKEWRKQFGKRVWRPDVDKRDWADSEDLFGSLSAT